MFHSVFQAGLSLYQFSVYFYLSHLFNCFFFFLVFSLRDFWQIKHIGFPGGLVVKNLPTDTGDTREVGSIHGSGRSPGRGHGNPVQYSCLENSMGRRVWWVTVYGVTKSWTRLSTQVHRAVTRSESYFLNTLYILFWKLKTVTCNLCSLTRVHIWTI